MKVRYYSVARDEYEGGSCPVCARCGANMRHVTEINGATYGSGCGKIVLGELEAKAKAAKPVVSLPSVWGKPVAKSSMPAKRDYAAEYWAKQRVRTGR